MPLYVGLFIGALTNLTGLPGSRCGVHKPRPDAQPPRHTGRSSGDYGQDPDYYTLLGTGPNWEPDPPGHQLRSPGDYGYDPTDCTFEDLEAEAAFTAIHESGVQKLTCVESPMWCPPSSLPGFGGGQPEASYALLTTQSGLACS
jgi:hypothetical protein